MKSLPPKIFSESVLQWFGPVATKLNAPLKDIGDGVCEIVSAGFALRIRLGKGHRKNLLVTMIPADERSDDVNYLNGEIGLGVIIEYFGHQMSLSHIRYPSEINSEMKMLSEYVMNYCSGMLLGESNEWNKIKSFVEGKIVKSGIRDKKFKFPPNVLEVWKLK